MNAAQKFLMVAMIALGAALVGGAFGYDGGFGVVVGGTGFWFSPAMSMVGGFAGFGLFIAAWLVGDEIGTRYSQSNN